MDAALDYLHKVVSPTVYQRPVAGHNCVSEKQSGCRNVSRGFDTLYGTLLLSQLESNPKAMSSTWGNQRTSDK